MLAEDNDAGDCDVAIEIGTRQVARKERVDGRSETETNPRGADGCVRVLIISTR